MRAFISAVLAFSAMITFTASAVPGNGYGLVHRPEKDRRENTILYQVKPDLSASGRAALAAVENRYGLRLEKKIVAGKINKARAQAPGQLTEEEICEELLRTGAVEFAEPDYLEHPSLIPNDTYYGNQWHHPLMNSPAAWDITTGRDSIIVAVCDTGVQASHPDLAGNVIQPGFNSVDNSTNSDDFWGHGTSVAGCIAAIGNNGAGVAGFGWNVKILPIRISNNESTATAYISDMAEAMRYAVDNGAKVVNLSYGGAYSATIDSAAQYVRSKGGLHFMSAGNDNTDLSGNQDWASFVIVGATDATDSRASFSNYGTPVDITAPGVSIRTTRLGSSYGNASGTSFSSPIAAGVGALIYSINPNFTPDQVENFIFSTTVDIGAAGEDSVFGHGRVNAGAAILAASQAVGNPTPVAVLSAAPVSGVEPLLVSFSGSASYDDGTITGYAWNFGDGASASGIAVSHTYQQAGDYTATLTVTDNLGQQGSDSVLIEVLPDPNQLFPPSGLAATVNGSVIVLNWTDNSVVEDGFHVERGIKVKRNTTWTRIATVGANITSFSETVSDGTYLYRVNTFSQSQGESAYTDAIQVKVGGKSGGGGKGGGPKR